MKLEPEKERAFRERMNERYGNRLGNYDGVIFGLGNALFLEDETSNLLEPKDYLEELYAIRLSEKPILLGRKDNIHILYSSTLPGAPSAAFYIESFFCHSPAKLAVGVGYVGGLQADIELGDIVIPNYAYRGEGTSKYYFDERYEAKPFRKLFEKLVENTRKEGFEPHVGKIYTTDSFHMETEEFIKKLNKEGYLGIEMEVSALFSIADWHKKYAATILVVTDNPSVNFHDFIFEKPKIARKNLQKAIKIATNSLVELINELRE